MWRHPILDHSLISTRYFFPRAHPLGDGFWVEGEAGPLSCWRSPNFGSRPVLLHFHGNGEVVGDYIPGFASLVESWGFDVFLAEYRGYGASAGEPALAGMLRDVGRIMEALAVSPERVVVFGRSVGSIYAIEAVHRYPGLAGLVLESGIADVGERIRLRVSPRELGCRPEELSEAVNEYLDHEAKLSAYRGPSLLLHAEHDRLVTIDHAERNYTWLGTRDEAKHLIRLPRGDHNSIMFANQARYESELRDFLRTQLREDIRR